MSGFSTKIKRFGFLWSIEVFLLRMPAETSLTYPIDISHYPDNTSNALLIHCFLA